MMGLRCIMVFVRIQHFVTSSILFSKSQDILFSAALSVHEFSFFCFFKKKIHLAIRYSWNPLSFANIGAKFSQLPTSSWISPLTPHIASPHPSFFLPCPLSLLLSRPFLKVTQLVAPYSHQLTPPAPPSPILPTSFGSLPCISVPSTLPLPFSSPLSNPLSLP